MRARDFDSRLDVYRMVQKKGEYGAIVAEYEPVKTIAADRVKHDGRKMIVVGEQFPYYTADYNIRDGNEIKEGWRVKDLDTGIEYEVAACIRDRIKRMITIKCIGVNPNGDDSGRDAEGAEGDLP